MRRKTIKPIYSMCVQPSFIIGTNNEDGSYNFAPITWVSATYEGGEGYLLVISMSGTKKTRQNVNRTGIFSANLVNKDMLPLMDYLGSKHAAEGNKDDVEYGVSRGEVLDVPTLNDSPWVYECEVERSVETGESVTFFCHIRNNCCLVILFFDINHSVKEEDFDAGFLCLFENCFPTVSCSGRKKKIVNSIGDKLSSGIELFIIFQTVESFYIVTFCPSHILLGRRLIHFFSKLHF